MYSISRVPSHSEVDKPDFSTNHFPNNTIRDKTKYVQIYVEF